MKLTETVHCLTFFILLRRNETKKLLWNKIFLTVMAFSQAYLPWVQQAYWRARSVWKKHFDFWLWLVPKSHLTCVFLDLQCIPPKSETWEKKKASKCSLSFSFTNTHNLYESVLISCTLLTYDPVTIHEKEVKIGQDQDQQCLWAVFVVLNLPRLALLLSAQKQCMQSWSHAVISVFLILSFSFAKTYKVSLENCIFPALLLGNLDMSRGLVLYSFVLMIHIGRPEGWNEVCLIFSETFTSSSMQERIYGDQTSLKINK